MTRQEILSARRDPHDGLVKLQAMLAGFPGWELTAEVDDSADFAELVGLRLQRTRDTEAVHQLRARAASSLTASILRAVSLTGLLAAAGDVREPSRRLGPELSSVVEGSDQYWAVLASVYVDTVRADPKRAVANLADELQLPRSVVRDRIHACRVKGYLTPGPRGRAGGELTPRARQALEGMGM